MTSNTPSFPLRHLPPAWAAWVESAALRSAAPADHVAAGLFASLSSLTGSRIVAAPLPDWHEPLHLWLCQVGGPLTGKSRGLDAVERLAAITVRQDGLADWLGRRTSRAAPSVVGGIRPGELASLFAGRDEGLSARFLYVWPDRPVWRPLDAASSLAPPPAAPPLQAVAGLVPDGSPPLVLSFTPEAFALYDAFCARNYEEVGAGEDRLSSWLAGARSAVARLALALALLDWTADPSAGRPSIIAAGALTRAIALYEDYFRPQAARVLDRCAESQRLAPVERVKRWLRDSGVETVSRDEVRRQGLAETLDAAGTARVIVELEAAGVLRLLPREEGKAGRPSDRWAVVPERVLGRREIAETPGRRRGAPVAFELPEIRSSADLRTALVAIGRQTAEGKLAVSECRQMKHYVEAHLKIIDLQELEGRLHRIEAAVAHDARVKAALPKPKHAR